MTIISKKCQKLSIKIKTKLPKNNIFNFYKKIFQMNSKLLAKATRYTMMQIAQKAP
jgi:hypothetical protein